MLTGHARPARVGIVGGGLIAQLAHLPLVRAAREVRLVALAEPAADVRSALQTRYGIPSVFADHRAMLAAGAVDAVVVCSPNESHAAVTLDAIAAGCAVLVEKPLCLEPEDGRAILAAAQDAHAVVQVAYMKQFDDSVCRFMRSLPRTELRRVASHTVDNAIGRRFEPAGFIRPSTPAGGAAPSLERAHSLAFCGALIHDVNLVLNALEKLGLGVDRLADAAASLDATSASCECELSSGARWTSSWRLAPDARRFTERLRFTFADGSRSLSLRVPYGDAARVYGPQLRHFAARIAARDASPRSIEEGIRDVALMAEARHRLRSRAEALTA